MDVRDCTAALQDKIILNSIPTAYFLFDQSYEAIDCNRAAVSLFASARDKSSGNFAKTHALPCEGICDNCTAADNVMQCPGRLYLIEHALYIYPGYAEDKTYTQQVVAKACARALAEGRMKFEHTFSTLLGDMVPCEVTIVPLRLHSEQGYVYYFRDLHESRRIRAEMKSREAAEEESRAKTRFLARMSHEIRTPMNAVLGITEIELQKGGLAAETKEALLRIYSSSSLLLTIINDILDFSKVAAGKMEIIANPYEIASLIVDTVQLNLIYSIEKQIKFNLSVDAQIPSRLVGDELRIKQILNNILSNAFKYTPQGRVSLSVGIENDPDTGLTLLFKVQDTGQGMSREQIEALFDEFSRFNIQSNPDIEGAGLGMSITHQLVSLMGGEILVESEPGAGSVFTVRIPQLADGSGVIGEELAESLQSMEISLYKDREKIVYTSLPYGKVLIVDDVESNLYVAKRLLEPYELTIDEASSGYEALSKLKYGEEYDIIFMDHMMPGIDGIETVKRIRELCYEHPIVALTANMLGEQSRLFEKNGFDGFISKPIDIRTLDAYIVKFIRDKYPSPPPGAQPKQSGHTPPPIGKRLEAAVARDIRLALETLDRSYETFADADMQPYIISTHAMKNALDNMGEALLSQMAAILEQAARNGSLSDVRALSPGFVLRLRETLKSLIASPDENYIASGDRNLEDIPFLKAQMEALQLACNNFNVTKSWQIMDDLEQELWTKETKDLLSKITDFITGGYFEEAAELAQSIAEER